MKPGIIPAVISAAVLALSPAVAYALPENYEARLRELNSTICDDAPGFRLRFPGSAPKDFLPEGGYKAGQVISLPQQ